MFLPWLKKKNSSLLGIHFDIGSIKLVDLFQVSNGYQLNCFIHFPIHKDKQKINIENKILLELADLIKKKGIKATEVNCAIRHDIVLTKMKFIDARLTTKEIHTYVMRQVEEQLGSDLKDYCIDYTLLSQPQLSTGLICIRWAVAKRQDIEAYASLINKLTLTPKVIEVDAFAIQRASSLLSKQIMRDSALALVQINADSLMLQILQNNQLLYMDEARTILENDDHMLKAIINLIQIFSSSSSIKIEKIFLAGESANTQLTALITHYFNIDTCLANFSDQLYYAASVDQQQFKMISHGFLICCGLAMWESKR